VREADFAELLAFRRLWSDWALAVSYYLDAVRPVSPEKEAAKQWPSWEETEEAYRQILIQKPRRGGWEPAAFWRTLRDEPFLPARGRPRAAASDDPGRARALAFGYRLLGGPAPFLILWLGALVAVPIVVWTAWETVDAGWPVAGAVFLLLVAASPFVVESLAFPRASVGFYVAAVLLLVPLAVYAALGRPTPRGLALRALLAGAFFALCALCRSGTLFLLPGFALAILVGARRAAAGHTVVDSRQSTVDSTGRRGRRSLLSTTDYRLLTAALAALLVAPYLFVRPAQRHETWGAIWEGLGDFDRTKGHSWSDPAAEAAARAEGADGLTTPSGQAALRRLVLRDVRQDPLWYGGILARRLAATVTLRKLWPRTAADGLWMTRSTSANEGFMDKYWTYTSTVDFLGPPSLRVEVPVWLMLLPTAALAALAARARAEPERSGLWVLACAAAATLPLPVLVSTASGHEPQSYAVTYALGAALLAERLIRRAAPPAAGSGSRAAPGEATPRSPRA
jgi:hypothetical protein